MDRTDSNRRRLCLRHSRVQLRATRGAEERARLGLPGVESEGGRLRELRERLGRPQRPTIEGKRDRASARAGPLVRQHSCRNSDGAFQRRRCREGVG